jgi:molybdenum cofactor cytidylyltransferase
MGLRVAAIVLAAGTSSRMAGRHKLLLETGGMPMIRRCAQAVLAFRPAETIVVTGFGQADIHAALSGLPLRFVHNPQYNAGQPVSVAAGIRVLTEGCDAVMVVLGDQALLTGADLARLATAYSAAVRPILVPFHNGCRGNPVIFAACLIPEVIAGGVKIGCRRLIDANPDKVARVEFDSDAFTFDCDTPDDYAALTARLGERASPDAAPSGTAQP